MLKVALTGGIASGKSSVARAFSRHGVPVIDTDRIARQVVETGSKGLAALVKKFGGEILDASGNLDRARLRNLIFEDTAARESVNLILHPLILDEVDRELSELARENVAPYAIVEIPLLTEARLAARFDRILVVDVPESVQVTRLQARDGVSESQASAALAAQSTRSERLALATDVIDNSGNLAQLNEQVDALHARYVVAAKAFATPSGRPSK